MQCKEKGLILHGKMLGVHDVAISRWLIGWFFTDGKRDSFQKCLTGGCRIRQ